MVLTLSSLPKGSYQVTKPVPITKGYNNNPFNIKVGSETQQYITDGSASVGSAATDGGNFLKFNDRNAAVNAAQGLLFKSGVYKGLTVDAALKKWSNNAYGGNIAPSLATSSIDSLTPDQQTELLNAMELKGENDAPAPGALTLSGLKPGSYTIGAPKNQQPPTQTPQSTFAGAMSTQPNLDPNAPKGPAFSDAMTKIDPTDSQAQGVVESVTSGEQSLAKAATGAIGAPAAQKTADDINTQKNANLQTAIKERNTLKAAGKDTTKVDALIAQLNGSSAQASDTLSEINTTPGEVIEGAVSTALDIASAGTYGAATKTMEAGKFAKSMAPSAVAVANKGVDALAQRSAAKETAKITEALTPALTPNKYKTAGQLGQLSAPTLTKAAGVAGDAVSSVKDSVQAVYNVANTLGKTAREIVRPGASATSNVNRVLSAISEHAQTVIKPFLTKNPVPVNFENFIDYMKNVQPNGAIKASEEAFPTFNRVRERVISTVYSSLKAAANKSGSVGALTDMNDFWNARKTIDSVIEEELGAKTLADPAISGIKAASKTLRAGVADFISDSMRFPGQMEKVAVFRNTVNSMKEKGMELGEKEFSALADQMGLKATGAKTAAQWDQFMKDSSGLYKAGDNLLTKVRGEMGKTTVKLWAKRHPGLVKALEFGAGAIGLEEVYKHLP